MTICTSCGLMDRVVWMPESESIFAFTELGGIVSHDLSQYLEDLVSR